MKKNFYAEIPVKLKLSGSYHDLGLFYDKVANFPRIVNISDIEIDKSKVKKAKVKSVENVLHASCTAKTYKFIEEQAGGKAKKNAKKKKK